MPLSFFNNFIDRRYPHLDEEEQRNVFVFYILSTILLVAILPWIFIFNEHNAPLLVYMHIGLVGSFALLLITSAFYNLPFKWSRFFLVILALGVCVLPPIGMGKDSVTTINILLLPMGMILIFSRKERNIFLRYITLVVCSFAFMLYRLYYHEPLVNLPKETISNFNFNDLINSMLTAIVISYFFWRKNTQMQTSIIEERLKSDNLLISILPEAIAKRLRGSRESVVDSFEKVTIIFADIVGFTRFSDKMSPQRLVDMLDEIFSDFDTIADKYHIEKIKTIGDAYMAVSGLPIASDNHCHNVADFALEINQLIIEKYLPKYGLEIRIGVNTGKAVAGVIGTKKFSYDLWGRSVNTASRFEAQGQPSKIHITEDVKLLLEDEYHIKYNGDIAIKGMGMMTSYFLLGKKGEERKRNIQSSPIELT